MPRIAASMAVLLTVAVSIGFNAVRYPVVWEMVAEGRYPEQPAEASEASSVSSSPATVDSAPSDEVGSSAARVLETTQESPASGSLYESTENTPPIGDALSGLHDLGPTAITPLAALDAIAEAEPMTPMTAVARVEDRPAEHEPDSDRKDDPLAANRVSPMAVVEPAGKYAVGTSSVERESDREMVPMRGLGALDEPRGWPAEWEAAALRATTAEAGSITAGGPPDRAETVRPLPPLDRVWTPPQAADEGPFPDGRIPIYPSTDSRGA